MKESSKKIVLAAVLVCTLALGFALVGCSSGDTSSSSGSSTSSDSSASSSNSSASSAEIPEELLVWAGNWTSKSEIVPGEGEVETSAYTINLDPTDMTFTVTDDGKELYTGTWEAESDTAGSAETSDGEAVRLEIAGGTKLIFDGSESGAKKIICLR